MNKIALVVGVNDYQHFDKLDKCVNDAVAMSEFLEVAGFEVILLKKKKKNDLEEAIKLYKAKINDDGVALFYYSGHGLQLEQYNFLVSVDSEIKTINDIPYNSTNLSVLLSDLEEDLKFTHIIILDACRKNPFNTGLIETIPGIEKKSLKKGTLIAYAASPGKPSLERKEDKNGVFTQHLLSNLYLTNINIEQVLKNTRTEVLSYTDNRQLTWEETSLYGKSFVFLEEDETTLEFKEIIDKYLGRNENLLLQEIYPFLQPKYFHTLNLEHLHFALTLTVIAFEDEKKGITKATMDVDYFTEELIDKILPLFQTRLINEDVCENVIDESIFEQIKITKEINYGYNEVLTVEDAFPHFMINYVILNEKDGLLSCFLSFESGKHFIKPMLYIKDESLEIVCFKTLYGDEALAFFKKFVEFRTPYEKEKPDLMEGFTSATINSLEELMDFFKDDFEENKDS